MEELNESLERFKGYNQAYYNGEHIKLLKTLHGRAVEISKQNDFIEEELWQMGTLNSK